MIRNILAMGTKVKSIEWRRENPRAEGCKIETGTLEKIFQGILNPSQKGEVQHFAGHFLILRYVTPGLNSTMERLKSISDSFHTVQFLTCDP